MIGWDTETGRRMGLLGDGRLALLRLHRSGVRPVRLLLVGDRRQLARGADATLAQRVVDRVWLTTRRGADADVLTEAAPALRQLAAEPHRWRLWRYDAVLVLVDDAGSSRQRAQVLRGLESLLRADAEHGTPVGLLLAGGDALERGLLRAAARAGGDGLQVLAVAAGGTERDWAAAAAVQVEHALRLAGPGRGQEDDEAQRQRALDASGVLRRRGDPRLADLVELARTAFGTQSAEINFIDRDRQWKLAVAGAAEDDNPRAHSFCSQTIRRPEPLVVGDARLHPVLCRSPMAIGPGAVRFYAAYPIESLDGYRIGAFCVYDRVPRDVRDLDLAVLRDLALLAQAELIAQDTAPAGSSVHLAGG